MSTELQTQAKPPVQKPKLEAGGRIASIVPHDIEQVYRMADAIFMSGMYPDSYAIDMNGRSGRQFNPPADPKGTTARIVIGLLKALEVGLPPITGLSTIYIVNNRPTIFGDGVPALLYASGKIDWIKEECFGTYPNEDFKYVCTIKRKDQPEPIAREFSLADAKKASLLGKTGPWQTHPKRQIQMRARGFAARDGAADILNGLGIYEEVIDIPQKAVEVDKSSLDDDIPDGFLITNEPAIEMPVIEQTEQPEPAVVKESFTPSDGGQVGELATACQRCNGRRFVLEQETDPETGELYESKGPCPDCAV